jgi:mannitol-1-phosphate 5-dehydrogenase
MVVSELANAGIAAVAVGLNGIKGIFPLLSKGLEERFRSFGKKPIDLIIAENMRNADFYFHAELKKLLPLTFPLYSMLGLIETSIGKMVPIMQNKYLHNDCLRIFAEPYNTLILNKKAFKNPIPSIEGLAPKENIKAWVDRKLFIHNLGHAAVAYIGYSTDQNYRYLYEALANSKVYQSVKDAMLQASEILLHKYPGEFKREDLIEHIEDLLMCFQNKHLGDTLFRVGSDLFRKLGPEDRLSGAIKDAMEFHLPYDKILYVLFCACHFQAKNEDGKMTEMDKEFQNCYSRNFSAVLKEVCGFTITQCEDIKKIISDKNKSF